MTDSELSRFLLAATCGAVLAVSTATAQSPAPVVNVEDYILDKDQMVGKQISVIGFPMCITMELCYLHSDGGTSWRPAVSVMFNAASLPREDRKMLLQGNPLTGPLLATVTFRVTSEMLGSKATAIQWNKAS
jgi:hypothetical protein